MTDLSGSWTGSFAYPGQMSAVPFSLELRDHGGQLSGVCDEPAPPALGGGRATSLIEGRRSGSQVRFAKVYDDVAHFRHRVDYRGTLDPDECEISGTWSIEGDWSGPFVMTRPRRARAERAKSVSEKV